MSARVSSSDSPEKTGMGGRSGRYSRARGSSDPAAAESLAGGSHATPRRIASSI